MAAVLFLLYSAMISCTLLSKTSFDIFKCYWMQLFLLMCGFMFNSLMKQLFNWELVCASIWRFTVTNHLASVLYSPLQDHQNSISYSDIMARWILCCRITTGKHAFSVAGPSSGTLPAHFAKLSVYSIDFQTSLKHVYFLPHALLPNWPMEFQLQTTMDMISEYDYHFKVTINWCQMHYYNGTKEVLLLIVYFYKV